jgi:two-component sensor histidine kinase
LNTNDYPFILNTLNLFLFLIPVSVYIFGNTDLFNQFRNTIPILALSYLILITIYLSYKKNRQAYFILFGWFILLIAGTCMYLSSTGLFNVYSYSPYIVEIAILLEAVIFSIALADRINTLEMEKNISRNNLLKQKENENERLELMVLEKTNVLKLTLEEKELLLKELNHRVKNNMQIILSLIRLQGDKIIDADMKSIFITMENRIGSLSYLYDLLYQQDNIIDIDTYEYFNILIDGIKNSYSGEIMIFLDIKTKLKIDQAIYCGLIINELVTNSYKYAFINQTGTIHISLCLNDGFNILEVKDNGVGYDSSKKSNTLGTILIDTLVKKQLKGTYTKNTQTGVEVKIKWSNNGKN